MKTPEEFNVVSRIVSIKLKEFKLVEGLEDIKIESTVFDHTLNVEVTTSGLLSIDSKTKIFKDSTKNFYIGELIVTGKYEIQNFEKILSQFEKKIPTNLLAMFVGVQLSTARGFLICKTDGTPLEGIMFGIIDPLTFFPHTQTSE